MSEQEKKQVNLEIQLDEEMAQGMYVNMAVVQHNRTEFVIDCIFVPPGQPKAKVRSRVVLAPEHAKRLLRALSDNISRYEKNFGEINIPDPPPSAPHMPSSSTLQ